MLELKHLVKPFGSQGFLIGIGISALTYLLAPQIKETLRPAAVKGTQGLLAFGAETKRILTEGKEKISNVFSEKTEEVKDMMKSKGEGKQLASKLLQELKEERELSNKIMEELKNSIVSLREEISNIRKIEHPQES